MMLTARNIYIAAMAIGGLALGLASLRWPAVNDGPVPPLMSLLVISLAFDLVIMNRAAAGKAMPLQMSGRLMGFFAGGIIYLLLRTTLASA
ncbi:MAG: hypothetical protein JWO64_1738 [Hyphomicrobiales bacterium]|jgi:hypothetical protein|nr:hypothetical protein [Hyphomicrobiales bacterium]